LPLPNMRILPVPYSSSHRGEQSLSISLNLNLLPIVSLSSGSPLPRASPLPLARSLLLTPPKPSSIPFKQLSLEELALHREKGLCFNCDKKFSRSQKCASRLFLLIAKDDENSPQDLLRSTKVCDEGQGIESFPAQISLHTLSGHMAPKTLRLLGHLNGQPVWILIDVGSTHNFIQERLVLALGLPTQPTQPLRVMVGNGHELECHQWCRGINFQVQDQQFLVNFHVFPLCGANLVLGVE